MKLLILPSFLLLTAGLMGCGSGTEGNRPPAVGNSGPPPLNFSSSTPGYTASSEGNEEDMLQEELRDAIEDALDSGDEEDLLALFYFEDTDSETIDDTESLVANIFDTVIDDITFATAKANYERFDEDYRYTPNLEVLGEVALQVDSAGANISVDPSIYFTYGLIDGEYRLGREKREFMSYSGPRNQQLSFSISALTNPNANQFHVTASYKVGGLTRGIDAIKTAGLASQTNFIGQYIELLSVDQIVGDDDFYFQVFEDGELIHTSQTASDGATIQYVKPNI